MRRTIEWMHPAALLIFFSDRLLLKDTVFFFSRLAREPSLKGGEGKGERIKRGGGECNKFIKNISKERHRD